MISINFIDTEILTEEMSGVTTKRSENYIIHFAATNISIK